MTPEQEAMVDGVNGYRFILLQHPDLEDQELRLLGTSDTFTLKDGLGDLIQHAADMAAMIREQAAEIADLRHALGRARNFIHGPGDRPGPVLRQIDAALAEKGGA